MTAIEFAAYVASTLQAEGIEVVLSGGTCVSFYTDDRFVSVDIDLINTDFAKRNLIRKIMNQAGFHEKNRYFVHPDSEFYVEFPAGPLTVGKNASNKPRR